MAKQSARSKAQAAARKAAAANATDDTELENSSTKTESKATSTKTESKATSTKTASTKTASTKTESKAASTKAGSKATSAKSNGAAEKGGRKPSAAKLAKAKEAEREAARKAQARKANVAIIGGIVVAIAVVAVIVGVIVSNRSTPAQQVSAGGVPAGATVEGGYRAFSSATLVPDAPLLEIYEDFQCPACKQFEEGYGATIEELAQSGKIELRYHIVNFLDDMLKNNSSTRAANASFCAADVGKFQEFHDALYANQPAEGVGFTDATLVQFAKDAGISGADYDTWKSCADAGTYAGFVNKADQNAFNNGLRGTPTVKLNGEVVELNQFKSPEEFATFVENGGKSG